MWPFSSKKKREEGVNQNCIYVGVRSGYYKSEKDLGKDLLKAFPFLNKKDLKEIYKTLIQCVDNSSLHFRMMVPGSHKLKKNPSEGLLCMPQYGTNTKNCSCSNWLRGTCCSGPNYDTDLDRTVFLEGLGAEALPPSYRTGRHIHHMYDLMPVTDEDVEFLKKIARRSRDIEDEEEDF